ncbi:MAG TPA: signal peptidase I [Patescibacteria group bacterium]|jgi:signal peptidase I
MPRKPKAKPPHRSAVKNPDPSENPAFANIPAEPEQPAKGERALHAVWEVAKTVAFIVLVAVVVRAFLIQPFLVVGESMEPNFQNGNYLLVNQVSYSLGKPKRGDVAVFKAPPEPETSYIKRVVGLPGETVRLTDGKFVIVNEEHPEGFVLKEPYEVEGTNTLPESGQTSWTLGSEEYFVAGDNRLPGKSSDSRAWGPVPEDFLVGKVWLRVYPLAEFGPVPHERPTSYSFTVAPA